MMKWILSLIFISILSGCGKFLEDYSQDLVIPKTVQDLDELLLGNGYLPRKEVQDLRSGGLTSWILLLDDDINTVMEQVASKGAYEMDSYYFGYLTWQLEIGRSFNGLDLRNDNADWEDLYKRINAMNIILSEIDNMPQDVEQDRRTALRVKGESHFLRAQYYFTLANLYAGSYNPSTAQTMLAVPLKLTEFVEHDNQKETQFQRATIAQVYGQIVSDLRLAVSYLTESPQSKAYRASQSAAMLLLSRVYLYMQDWENAAAMAQQVVNKHGIIQNYASIDSVGVAIDADNPEIILSQGPLNMQNMMRARGGDFCISRDLYDTYSDDDYRKSLFFAKEVFTDSIAMSRKFKKGLHLSAVSDLYMLRSSEAYLNLMEANVMLGKSAEARNILDRFRSFRMSVVPADVYTQAELVQQIRMERRKELCMEGHRWFDLRRYAVDLSFPFKKDIIRSFAVYDWNDKNKPLKTQFYKLRQDDLAYIFSIPKLVLEFDRGMIDNPREVRKYFLETPYK